MQILERPKERASRKKIDKMQVPEIYDLSELLQEERRFRRCLEWGSMGVSVFMILIMFYLFGGINWVMGIIS